MACARLAALLSPWTTRRKKERTVDRAHSGGGGEDELPWFGLGFGLHGRDGGSLRPRTADALARGSAGTLAAGLAGGLGVMHP